LIILGTGKDRGNVTINPSGDAKMNPISKRNQPLSALKRARSSEAHHGRIVSTPKEGQCLDSVQLSRLEQGFRNWADDSSREDVRKARRRILILFLLIRFTGAKLNEVLALNPAKDIDSKSNAIWLRSSDADKDNKHRRVQISEALSKEIQDILSEPFFQESSCDLFGIDPGFVRRKFYERAQACGFPKRLGGPEMIRKARAVELMQGNLPLPVVQKILGHSTPNLTSSYVSFSAEEIEQVTKLFMDREAARKTSARNSFFGKIQAIQRGDIQSRVVLTTMSGYSITTVITNDSLELLALRQGRLITGEVKAPWVILCGGDEEPKCSSENRFNGIVERINKGQVNTEYTVRIGDGTVLCAVVSTESAQRLSFEPGEKVWAFFNCFSVVLHVS
jgi:molybdate transport system regulatory protein